MCFNNFCIICLNCVEKKLYCKEKRNVIVEKFSYQRWLSEHYTIIRIKNIVHNTLCIRRSPI